MARHLERASSRSALDHPRLDAAASLLAGKVARGRSSPAASSSSPLWALLDAGSAVHDARREDSRPARSPTSGTATSSRSKLVNPANKRKYTIIVVGTGLAGASAAASLGELGYNVLSFCIQDSPRRAHSIAAQGGINAAKNYQNDGDSIYRLFYDTVKGGDYRSREANVYRLAQLSVNIIDQCVAQGVPFAREYGGLLDNRSFGGAQVSRTFYARGQTGQQLLLGAYQSLMRQVARRQRSSCSRAARCSTSSSSTARRAASSCRNLVTGELERYAGRRRHPLRPAATARRTTCRPTR